MPASDAAETLYVLTCDRFMARPPNPDFLETCENQVWMRVDLLPAGGYPMPPLQVADASQIAVAIGGLWAAAWVIRLLRKSFETRIGI